MAIIKMKKVVAYGLDSDRKKVIKGLMKFGAMDISDFHGKIDDSQLKGKIQGYYDVDVLHSYEELLNKTQSAIEIANKYCHVKEPIFTVRKPVTDKVLKGVKDRKAQLQTEVENLIEISNQINALRENINRKEQELLFLEPWQEYGIPLEITETRETEIILGTIPKEKSLDQLRLKLEEEIQEVDVDKISEDKELQYISIVSIKSKSRECGEILKNGGFTRLNFKEYSKSVREHMDGLKGDIKRNEELIDMLLKEIETYSPKLEEIKMFHDYLSIAVDEEKVKEKLIRTGKTVFITGWIPERTTEKCQKVLDENGFEYEISEPEEDDEVPVMIENNHFFSSFEGITEMYSLPAYRGFDPTSLYALFFASFFGIMLSDAGYGLIMAVACFLILKKYDLEGSAKKMIKLFLWCGVSTVFWGAMFGGWFGDIVSVIGKNFLGKEIILKPLWFNPISEPIKLLIFSLALGVVHIFLGMGIKAYMQIRDGKVLDAIFDQGFWYILISGAIVWAGAGSFYPEAASVGKWMFIGAMAGLLLTGGRHNKGIGKVVGGLASLYNITGYLSDILSYSRLLALGLATGVIAQVVNTMGGLFGGGVVGGILLLIIFLFGHTLNFAINALGSYVHASRLQYIEFFGKFYEDGGEPFTPFARNTKYIKIIEKE